MFVCHSLDIHNHNLSSPSLGKHYTPSNLPHQVKIRYHVILRIELNFVVGVLRIVVGKQNWYQAPFAVLSSQLPVPDNIPPSYSLGNMIVTSTNINLNYFIITILVQLVRELTSK